MHVSPTANKHDAAHAVENALAEAERLLGHPLVDEARIDPVAETRLRDLEIRVIREEIRNALELVEHVNVYRTEYNQVRPTKPSPESDP